MRRKRMLPSLASIVTAAYLTFSPQPAEAQQSRTGKWYLGIMGALGKPQSPDDFKSYFSRTASLGLVGGRLPVLASHITGEFMGLYTHFPGRNGLPFKFNVFEAGVEVRAYLNDVNESASPYFAVGGTLALTDFKAPPNVIRAMLDAGGKTSEQRPGLVGGAGIQLFAGQQAAIDIAVRYHHLFTADEPTGYTTAGVRFNFLLGQ